MLTMLQNVRTIFCGFLTGGGCGNRSLIRKVTSSVFEPHSKCQISEKPMLQTTLSNEVIEVCNVSSSAFDQSSRLAFFQMESELLF